jgi:hypothetical protein
MKRDVCTVATANIPRKRSDILIVMMETIVDNRVRVNPEILSLRV